MTLDQLRKVFFRFPGVQEGESYGTPAFRLRKKLLARLHQSEHAVVLKVPDLDRQEVLIKSKPHVFFITSHYEGYAWVLARLSVNNESEIADVFEEAWRCAASKSLLAEFDGNV